MMPADPTAELPPNPRVLTTAERDRLNQLRREWTWYEVSPAAYHGIKFLLELLDRFTAPELKLTPEYRRENDGNDGKLTGVSCPACGARIVYNGNYFCEHWQYEAPSVDVERGVACYWALSHDDETGEPIGEVDRRVWAELQGREGV